MEIALRWRDGTTQVSHEPEAFLERLARLLPGASTILYAGIFAGHAARRSRTILARRAHRAAPLARALRAHGCACDVLPVEPARAPPDEAEPSWI